MFGVDEAPSIPLPCALMSHAFASSSLIIEPTTHIVSSSPRMAQQEPYIAGLPCARTCFRPNSKMRCRLDFLRLIVGLDLLIGCTP
jgi:hypothetical protein